MFCLWLGNSHLGPLATSADATPALHPVCGLPAVNYWLTFFRDHAVRNAFLVVSSESAQDALEAHIKKWGKMNYKGKMKTRVICAGGAETAGDALRRVYKEKCVSDDFLLATCENIPMGNNAASINQHFERKKGNKNCVMTKIMRPGNEKDSPFSSANFLLEKDNMEFLR